MRKKEREGEHDATPALDYNHARCVAKFSTSVLPAIITRFVAISTLHSVIVTWRAPVLYCNSSRWLYQVTFQ